MLTQDDRQFISQEVAAQLNRLVMPVLTNHGQILSEHTQILNEHTQALNNHTELLREHARLLKDHDERLLYLQQKMNYNHEKVLEQFDIVRAEIKAVKRMESEDIQPVYDDIATLKTRVKKLEKRLI